MSKKKQYDDLYGGVGRAMNFRAKRVLAREVADLEGFDLTVDGKPAQVHDLAMSGISFHTPPADASAVGDTVDLRVCFADQVIFEGAARIARIEDPVAAGASPFSSSPASSTSLLSAVPTKIAPSSCGSAPAQTRSETRSLPNSERSTSTQPSSSPTTAGSSTRPKTATASRVPTAVNSSTGSSSRPPRPCDPSGSPSRAAPARSPAPILQTARPAPR